MCWALTGSEPSGVRRAFSACTSLSATLPEVEIIADIDGFVPVCQNCGGQGQGDARSHHLTGKWLEMGHITVHFPLLGHWKERQTCVKITWALGLEPTSLSHDFPLSGSGLSLTQSSIEEHSLLPPVPLPLCWSRRMGWMWWPSI